MAATDWDEATFKAHRPLLFSIAYRMLGSASEAEDVVQDAWVRARQDEHADVRSPRAYLTTIVTRLCIDHLRSAERTRMEYPGPWLPEPLAEPNQESAELASSLTTAFLVLLEQLAPTERAVFLLREVCVLGYAGKMHWSESDFQLVTINGAPGLLMRHPISGNGTYSFDIADGRIRAIYVVRNPDKLRGFLEHTHTAEGASSAGSHSRFGSSI